MDARDRGRPAAADKVTKERMLGTERRWRRFGEPVPAGRSLTAEGSPDYGIFGPGSVVWDVLLHPAVIVFHHAGQQQMQDAYAPIGAGIRDHEPLTRKAREGTLTAFDTFERASRGAGMHLPLWLGDTPTAQLMAKHLHNIHRKVAGDLIDSGRPELGGYAASEPREAMWAALTEMHPMLRVYEAFAFRDGRLPHRLPAEKRDQFVAEVAAYCRLHGAPEDEIPTTMAELSALYAKYAELFTPSKTRNLDPRTGEDYRDLMAASIKKNFRPSHVRAIIPTIVLYIVLGLPVTGAMSRKARTAMGLGPARQAVAVASTTLALPLAWLMQRPRIERYYLRLMWGPDGVTLIESARALHAEARA